MNKENNCQCVVCNVEAALLDSNSTQMAQTQFQAGARNGKLTLIPHSIAFLSTSNSGPGSVALSPDGQFLVMTEKTTNNLDVFRVECSARLGPIVVNPSVGLGVFALQFAPNGAALASETGPLASALSSYAVQSNGTLSPISASVPTLGAATCGRP